MSITYYTSQYSVMIQKYLSKLNESKLKIIFGCLNDATQSLKKGLK